jgi:hypothetical protein
MASRLAHYALHPFHPPRHPRRFQRRTGCVRRRRLRGCPGRPLLGQGCPGRFTLGCYILIAALSVCLYLGFSYLGGYVGFPLDDAWIHQTYARNLGLSGQFAFIPGIPSAGSTSPLWSVLLALGYLLRIDYRVWTYGLGTVLLGLNAWLTYRLVLTLWPERQTAALLAGLSVALEWHMAWATVSGMETLLFSALALWVFVMTPRQALWLGVCVGLSILARPDGLTLLPFVLARIGFSLERRWRNEFMCVFGFGLVFLPYLAFNQWLGGTWWPNTFAAKQAEYAILLETPLLERLWQVGQQPLVGAQTLLLPGVLAVMWRSVRQKQWTHLLTLAWAGAFVLAYVLRLPVTYQHGRYLVPVIPVLVAVGLGGTAGLMRLHDSALLPRVLSRVWATTMGLLLIAFWFIGAQAYQRDVQIIETEMVASARWVAQNTPPDALIAAHDIGALGYFGERNILDLAGLVSPDVIPFIRDEDRLSQWLTDSKADFLATFPDWYSKLTRAAPIVFQTASPYSPRSGGTNMAVYRWPSSP